jgi:hypothetical protein
MRPAEAVGGERLLVNSEYEELLAAESLDCACAFLNVEGEIISGHPDRHVMRVRIGGIDAILKREHRVPWKDRFANWLAGFGAVSVSLREAISLQTLRGHRIDVPEWIATGESADGRAFLLVRTVKPAIDLRRYLHAERFSSDRERRSLARRLAREVARIHNLGFDYPDLYAKHILIDPSDSHFTFIDWQRTRRCKRLTWRRRCRNLAALHASISGELASEADRFAFLLAYYRAAGDDSMPFRKVCLRIQRRSNPLLQRSSIREQRLPAVAESQPLKWLDGESLCVTPLGQSHFDRESIENLAYAVPSPSTQTTVELSNGGRAALTRRVTNRRWRGLLDILKSKRWMSPEVRTAADLLRRERLGEPPRLLAFGQRMRTWGVVDSFVLALEGGRE